MSDLLICFEERVMIEHYPNEFIILLLCSYWRYGGERRRGESPPRRL